MASVEARDSSRAQALKNVKTARAYSNWIKFFRRSANIRIHRVVAQHWHNIGQYLVHANGLGIQNSPYSRHWGRLGHRLHRHKRYLQTLQ